MAEIITLQSAIVPILQQAAQKIADKYGGIRADETNWMIHCPIHDDQQASCHIQVTDKLLAYCHVCGKDKQKDLINKFKQDDVWVVIEQPQKRDPVEGPQSNIPAHAVPEAFPRYLSHQGQNHQISKIWTYHTETGHPAFWVMRADYVDALGKPHKIVKPFSSINIDGENVFKFTLQHSSRPLYNLPDLVNNPNKTVILVEGEKATDAAKLLLPDYVITCWSGGVNGFKTTNISHLINRDVILWPDNDEPGIKGMLSIAMYLPNAKIVFQEVQKNLPYKWDLGDPIPPDVDIAKMLQDVKVPVRVAEAESPDMSLEALKERYQRMENSGGIAWVDLKSRSFSRDPLQPYKIYTSRSAFYDAVPTVEHKFYEGKVHRVKVLDKYLEDDTQPIAHQMIFNPTTTDMRVWKNDVLYVNTFMGFEHEPKECDPALYQSFLDHINGILEVKCATWFLDFVSDMLQNIQTKPGVMPIFSGKPGTGKSLIGEVIAAMLGQRVATCIQCGALFDSRFNGQLSHKVWVSFDEVNLYGATNKHANESLKTMVTDMHILINEKYKPMKTEQSYLRLMGTTNVNMPVYIDMSDRRFALFSVADTFLGNKEHFNKLVSLMYDDTALSGLAYFFKNRKMTTEVRDVPQTNARILVQKPEDPILAIIFTILNDASLPEEISRRLVKCQWPQKEVLIPRFILNDYITRKHPTLAGHRLTMTLLDHFKWERPDGKYNNTKRMTINSSANSMEEVNKSVYQFKPIDEQRKIYEQATRTSPQWGEITFDEDPEELDLSSVKDPF